MENNGTIYKKYLQLSIRPAVWFSESAGWDLIPTQTIIDADYTDDIVLLANSPNQAESLQYSLE